MNTVLWVFIAFAFGLLLFTSIQDEIPEEFAFLKAGPSPTQQASAPAGSAVTTYQGWTVKTSGDSIEIIKAAAHALKIGNMTLQPPEIGLICFNGKLDARLNTRYATTGTKQTLVVVQGAEEQWEKGKSYNVFPPSAPSLYQVLNSAQGGALSVGISFKNQGLQTFTFDTAGAPELLARFPVSCRQ